MQTILIPKNIRPRDGRFGCGPSKVSDYQTKYLGDNFNLLGRSHRSSIIKDIFKDIKELLAEIYNIPHGYEIIFGLGGASLFWDAAAYSLVVDKAQAAVFGEFSAKCANALKAPHLTTPDIIKAEYGDIAVCSPKNDIDLYAYAHNETSTGVMSPVKRIPGGLNMVDGTSAAGGANIDLSELDIYYFSFQKNFASDGGLWCAIISPAAIERIDQVALSGRYIPEILSLKKALDNSRKNQTLNTPSIANLLLIKSQMLYIAGKGGILWADKHISSMSDAIYAFAENNQYLKPFVGNKAYRSKCTPTINLKDPLNADEIVKIARHNEIYDINSYRKLNMNQIRIATFVGISEDDINRLIKSLQFIIDSLIEQI